MDSHTDHVQSAIPVFLIRATLAALDTVRLAATEEALHGPYTLRALGATADQYRRILSTLTAHGMLERDAACFRLTRSGVRMRDLLAQADRVPLPTRPCPPDWAPVYQLPSPRARCLVLNVLYPDGSCGALESRSEDGQWRIARDAAGKASGKDDDPYATRDDAARALWRLALDAWRGVLAQPG